MFVVRQLEPRVNKTFRVPKGLLDSMTATAEKNNVSLNELWCQAAAYALANIEEMEEKNET